MNDRTENHPADPPQDPPKVAVVTGSGRRRIGNFVVRDLAAAGYSVVVHYHRSQSDADETVAELRSAGGEAVAIQADLGDEDHVNRLFDEVIGRFGRIDVLVNTSSVWSAAPLEAVTAEDVLANFRVNTLAGFLCSRRAGLTMASQPQGGSIILFGDWATVRPYRDYAAYFVSKGAIPTMTRSLAVELAARNPRVRVNCIHPGPVLFPPELTDAERKQLADATLVKSANCPEAICRAVRFLIENEFVTGACLPIDGGRTIYSPGDESAAAG